MTVAPDPRHLASAGWTEQDLAWEDLQVRAAEAKQAGGDRQAAELWAAALRLARAAFAANDPRLATSLANYARGLGDAATGKDHLWREALRIWDRCQPWVEALPPDRRSRSSTYHARLETRYKGAYDRFTQDRHGLLMAEGREALQGHLHGTGAPDNFARWCAERPHGYTGTRKLMAAAWLIAPADCIRAVDHEP